MRLVFHLPNSNELELEVSLDMTGLDLDKILREKVGLFIRKPNILMYLFEGQVMPRNEPIEKWNLKDGDDVFVTSTLLAG
ncbi:hypothetical protein M9Y10_030735 [Tritrichomonas musculus]|uniref:Ubiquitin-like domain-containing protein n=1 Tax=Tritrichomonas musculus TaxID=1915356 RepID=A0ABR2H4M8_9EUKA